MASLREKQKQQRLERIRQAAFALFEENGYAATSIEQIAERAEVSVGTLYNYYGSKAELLADAIKALLISSMDQIEEVAATFQGAAARRLARIWISAYEQFPLSKNLYCELYAALLVGQSTMRQIAIELYGYADKFNAVILRQCIKDGVLNEKLDVMRAAHMVSVALTSFEIQYYMGVVDDLESLEEQIQEMLETLFLGLEGELQ